MTGRTSVRRTARIESFLRDERGATAIEYALIAMGIAVAISVTLYSLGDVVLEKYYKRIAEETGKI